MEEELKCFVCKEFYREPVLLPCGDAFCRACALSLQTSVQEGCTDYHEADKASVTSETDSGVVCGSRPGSYAGTPAVAAGSYSISYRVSCPVCDKEAFLDDGVENLPPFRVLRSIVSRFANVDHEPSVEEACQMCEGDKRFAVVRCEQCAVRYCADCRDAWHPARGPLAHHELRAPGSACTVHNVALSGYCTDCQVAVCSHCVQERHPTCDTQTLAEAARTQKVISLMNLLAIYSCDS